MTQMKQEAIRKINKMGRAGLVVTRIVMVLLAVVFLGVLTVTMLMYTLPEDMVEAKVEGVASVAIHFPEGWTVPTDAVAGRDFSVSVAGAEFQLTDAAADGQTLRFSGSGSAVLFRLGAIRAALLSAVVYVILTLVLTVFVGRLCKAFHICRTPFCQDVISKMQQLAYAMIPWAVIGMVVEGICQGATGEGSFTFSVNLGYVAAILIILALVYVFKYGAMLQRESDETV